MTTKKGGSLTFPSDPLAAMRELSDLDAPAPDSSTPVHTEVREPVSTDGRTEASKQVSQEASPHGRTQGSPSARKPVREEASTAVSKPVRKDASPSLASDFLDGVEVALASREPLIGGVKATVDMSPELSTRAKRYLADHRGQNTRQVLIALFDAFLKTKGY